MTVSTLHVRTDAYAGDGVSAVFPVTFQFLAPADLRVIEVSAAGVETPKSLGADYTVSGGNGGTGNVTALSAPPAGVFWVIVRQTGRDQPISWAEGGPLTAASLQKSVDKNALLIQEADNRAERGVRLPDSDPDGINTTLPGAAARAGKAVVFSVDGGVAVSNDIYNDQLANVTAQAGVATTGAATATAQAGIATAGANTATTQAGIATAGAATATTQAGIATTQAATATTQAGIATTQATTATTQAGIATTQAGIATDAATTATTRAMEVAANTTTVQALRDDVINAAYPGMGWGYDVVPVGVDVLTPAGRRWDLWDDCVIAGSARILGGRVRRRGGDLLLTGELIVDQGGMVE